MREIKFRAWDKSDGRMLVVVEPEEQGKREYYPFEVQIGFSHFDKNDIILMQWTGLKDKNGTEIWEGDIIEHPTWNRPYSKKAKTWLIKKIVKWSPGYDHSPDTIKNNPDLKNNPSLFNQQPHFYGSKINRKDKDGGCNWSEFHNCEVIGNIYETPSLLPTTDKK